MKVEDTKWFRSRCRRTHGSSEIMIWQMRVELSIMAVRRKRGEMSKGGRSASEDGLGEIGSQAGYCIGQ
jgi:hypothetical protein